MVHVWTVQTVNFLTSMTTTGALLVPQVTNLQAKRPNAQSVQRALGAQRNHLRVHSVLQGNTALLRILLAMLSILNTRASSAHPGNTARVPGAPRALSVSSANTTTRLHRPPALCARMGPSARAMRKCPRTNAPCVAPVNTPTPPTVPVANVPLASLPRTSLAAGGSSAATARPHSSRLRPARTSAQCVGVETATSMQQHARSAGPARTPRLSTRAAAPRASRARTLTPRGRRHAALNSRPGTPQSRPERHNSFRAPRGPLPRVPWDSASRANLARTRRMRGSRRVRTVHRGGTRRKLVPRALRRALSTSTRLTLHWIH